MKQFKTYTNIQETKTEIEKYRSTIEKYSKQIIGNGSMALITGGITLWGITELEYTSWESLTLLGLMSVANFYAAYDSNNKKSKLSKNFGSLEKELQKLKSDPEYQAIA